jgi:hypothetical protein
MTTRVFTMNIRPAASKAALLLLTALDAVTMATAACHK